MNRRHAVSLALACCCCWSCGADGRRSAINTATDTTTTTTMWGGAGGTGSGAAGGTGTAGSGGLGMGGGGAGSGGTGSSMGGAGGAPGTDCSVHAECGPDVCVNGYCVVPWGRVLRVTILEAHASDLINWDGGLPPALYGRWSFNDAPVQQTAVEPPGWSATWQGQHYDFVLEQNANRLSAEVWDLDQAPDTDDMVARMRGTSLEWIDLIKAYTMPVTNTTPEYYDTTMTVTAEVL